MTWTTDDLRGLNWSDDSPPNLMLLGDKMASYEAHLKSLGLIFSENYPGAEEIFERMMMANLSLDFILPNYRSFCELACSSEISQVDLNEILAPILNEINVGANNKNSTEPTEEITKIVLSDQNEKLDLVNFIQEALEQLSHLENQLPELKDRRTDGTFLNTLFRRIHTIKGASGFFGLTHLTHISHELENVMDKARNGNLDINDEVVSLLVRGGEWMNSHLNEILLLVEEAGLPCSFSVGKGSSEPVHYGCLAVLSRPDAEVKMEKTVTKGEDVLNSTIQISQDYLDEFIQDVGDLLNLAHIFKHSESRLAASAMDREDIQRFKANFFALEEKTDSLQRRLMQLRRVKIKQLLDKVPKIIFRLMQVVSKKVKVEIKGENIEIDRSMLSVLEDPFVHILRNSMDHGIELPQDRIALGKPEEGNFRISVTSSQNLVHICIEDDGRGIDGEMVARKAVEKGVVTQNEVDQMSSQQKQDLIFIPSFSTRDAATEISGRGVGMDVVKSKISGAGGTMTLRSKFGEGTKLMISLPIAATLSTRSILRVKCGEQWFGLGMDKIECIACHPRQKAPLPRSGPLELFPYRGLNIPVLSLAKLFKIESQNTEYRSFIILQELEHGLALEVDDFSEFETHVMQHFLEGHFENTPFEGASVMGDGSICQLISFDKVMKIANLKRVERSVIMDSDPQSVSRDQHCMLILKPSLDSLHLSINMDWVSRIEIFDKKCLNIVKHQRVYRCSLGLLQYFELSEFGLGKGNINIEDITRIVVLQLGVRQIALGVHQIIDMYSGEIDFLGRLNIPGVINSWSHEDHLVGVVELERIKDLVRPKDETRQLVVN